MNNNNKKSIQYHILTFFTLINFFYSEKAQNLCQTRPIRVFGDGVLEPLQGGGYTLVPGAAMLWSCIRLIKIVIEGHKNAFNTKKIYLKKKKNSFDKIKKFKNTFKNSKSLKIIKTHF